MPDFLTVTLGDPFPASFTGKPVVGQFVCKDRRGGGYIARSRATIVGMPERSRKQPKRPVDVNELAARIVGEATGEIEAVDPDTGKDPAAVALGRRGGLKGGKARAAKMTPEQRSEAARRAAAARWGKPR